MNLTEMRMQERGHKIVRLDDWGNCPLVSGPDLAVILDVTEQRVRQLVKRGMPKVSRGMYPLFCCLWWYTGYCKRVTRVRKRSKVRELIRRQKHEGLVLRNELLRIKLKMTSDELVADKLRKGRELLVHGIDCQIRRLPKKLERRLGWDVRQTQAFEEALSDAREDLIEELYLA